MAETLATAVTLATARSLIVPRLANQSGELYGSPKGVAARLTLSSSRNTVASWLGGPSVRSGQVLGLGQRSNKTNHRLKTTPARRRLPKLLAMKKVANMICGLLLDILLLLLRERVMAN
jgi:hypothetical protein